MKDSWFLFELNISSFWQGNPDEKETVSEEIFLCQWNSDGFWQAPMDSIASDWRGLEETWHKKCVEWGFTSVSSKPRRRMSKPKAQAAGTWGSVRDYGWSKTAQSWTRSTTGRDESTVQHPFQWLWQSAVVFLQPSPTAGTVQDAPGSFTPAARTLTGALLVPGNVLWHNMSKPLNIPWLQQFLDVRRSQGNSQSH